MNKIIKTVIILIVASTLLFSSNVFAQSIKTSSSREVVSNKPFAKIIASDDPEIDDYAPGVDAYLTVTIKKVRALDKIDLFSDPDFYVKVYINDKLFQSDVIKNKRYIYGIPYVWQFTDDIPDEERFVKVRIELWDWNPGKDTLCDISRNYEDAANKRSLDLVYDLESGHWRGDLDIENGVFHLFDDYIDTDYEGFDRSGYGRANGCDDDSIYDNDYDCEIWFDISHNDRDGDGIPYWSEVNVWGTDPTVDDTGRDDDGDGVPIEWEHKWGYTFWFDRRSGNVYHTWIYDPFKWEDHRNIDVDMDGIDNYEEYLTSKWGSDPFRRDIFLEVDQMEKGPNGEGAVLPDLTKDLMIDPFDRRNIVLHFNEGWPGGGEFIPFDLNTTNEELQEFYFKYFMHENENNWKRGVMHYILMPYKNAWANGFAFSSNVNDVWLLDCASIETKYHDDKPLRFHFIWGLMRMYYNKKDYYTFSKGYQRAVSYASVLMHELGHSLGIFSWNVPGCDNWNAVWFRKDFFKYHGYRSCMNYCYTYLLVDYSDGSHGRNDNDDWDFINLRLFQIPR